jgi:tyrosinase
MAPATSPNDPVFYLNHCNVDRIWAAWQAGTGDRTYLPRDSEPATLFRHRTSDPLLAPFFQRDAAGPRSW